MSGKDVRSVRNECEMENQVKDFALTNAFRESFAIDGEPIEFEWKVFPGLPSLEILQKIQRDLNV